MYGLTFVLALVCLSVSAHTQPRIVGKNGGCCLPNKMEMLEGMVLGGKRNATLGSLYVAMDQTKEKIFVNMTLFDGANKTGMMMIQDFKHGWEYVLVGANCTKKKLGPWTKRCIPAGSVDLGSSYFGHAGKINGLNVNTYMFSNHTSNNTYTAYITVTQEPTGKACLPVNEVAFGHRNKTSWTGTFNFVNITMGVTNPHIFDLPTMCKKHPIPPHPKKRCKRCKRWK